MVLEVLNTFMSLFQIFMQFIAAYIAYHIYTFNRLKSAWLTVCFAFLLMGIQRVTTFLVNLGILPEFERYILWIDNNLLPFVITFLLLVGLWSMMTQFRDFEIIHKKVTRKVKNLKKKSKK
jgi:hypothetical protein